VQACNIGYELVLRTAGSGAILHAMLQGRKIGANPSDLRPKPGFRIDADREVVAVGADGTNAIFH
jgi:hypothetical protein